MDLIKSRESRGPIAQVLLNSIFCPTGWTIYCIRPNAYQFVGLSCNDIAIDAGGLGFAPWAGQIGQSIARDMPPRCFLRTLKLSCLGDQRRKRVPLLVTRFGGIPRV